MVGGGLAGCEVSYFLAKQGIKVKLYEMRPKKMTEVHRTGRLAELVCSNSFKSIDPLNAEGILKKEMKIMGSIVMNCAYKTKVPAGKALAVDRDEFSECVTNEVLQSGVILIREEITKIDPKEDEIWVIATGPATSLKLADYLTHILGEDFFYFFDAVAPIVTKESIDMEKAFIGDRYGVGSGDYINCPMTKEEYEKFWLELIKAETIPIEDFDKKYLFDRCRPVEDIAKSGEDALLYGPLKPKGLIDPKTGKEPYAVVQLRQDNIEGTLYNIVGFQTRLRWKEQRRVFRMIPCLKNAEFVRYGVMHRNIYINSREVLDEFLRLKKNKRIFFAGQITGVEGYLESAATGLYVGYTIKRMLDGKDPITLPIETMLGSLIHYITKGAAGKLKPMYANFGLFPDVGVKDKKKRKQIIAKISVDKMKRFVSEVMWCEV